MNLLDLGKQPIEESQPAGEEVRYAPEYEALQVEIDKLSIATADGAGIDWDRVISLSTQILGEKSKNIQVACYLGAALIETRQFEGLADGLVILKDLADNFWDTLYPPKNRMRGRLSAVNWWMERAEAFLKSYAPAPLPVEIVERVKGDLEAFDRFLSDRSEDAPMVSRLLGYINRLPTQSQAAPGVEAAPEGAPAKTGMPSPSGAAPTSSPASISLPSAAATGTKTQEDAQKLTESGLDLLSRASDLLMQQDPSAPVPYRLKRIAAWLPVERPPIADGATTLLPPPEVMVRSSIENLMAARDYLNAIIAAESRVPEFLFWLDLSRWTADALDRLGGRYQDALEAVNTETALYVKRLPGIENLTFSDGTPFADRDTRAWLKAIALDGGAASLQAAGSGIEAEVAEAYGQAQELIKEKKSIEALTLIQNRCQHCGSGKARLLWRIALAQILLDMAQPELAWPHLDEILAVIDSHQLESWDPDLALAGCRVVYAGLSDAEDEERQALARKTLARIARISPTEAISLIKS